MDSSEAVDWLIQNYPVSSIDYGEALALIPHRSWRKDDQLRLARYYFTKLPFASARGYEAFASIMSIHNLILCISENLPINELDKELLLYHAIPTLNKAAKNERDQLLINKLQKN
ncbi:hypothetical protein [Pseudomonas syringae]|uniref:Uncharacterized protein n=1 Tax=Pseudomonas syringae CC1417 TaxID=1357272 RepID=A0AAU8LLD6_PSESX